MTDSRLARYLFTAISCVEYGPFHSTFLVSAILPCTPVDAPTRSAMRIIAPIRTELICDGFIIRLVFGESRYEKAANAIPARNTPPIMNLEL